MSESDSSSSAEADRGWPASSGMDTAAFQDMSSVLEDAMDVDGAAAAAAPKSQLKEGAGWLGGGGLGGYDFGDDARARPPAQPPSPGARGC